MAIYLRQICLVASKLQPAINDLSTVFSIPECYRDPAVGKFGLENALLAIGSQFIEVVAPIKAGTAASRFLARRGGDGGYMVICQTPTLAEQAAIRQRATENNVRVAYESDRETWNIMQLHPADMGAAFFEVDWDEQEDVTGYWHPAGGDGWQQLNSTQVVSRITAVELQSDEPNALARQWAKIAGATVNDNDDQLTLSLANIEIRFVQAHDGRGPGLSGLDFLVHNKAKVIEQAYSRGIAVDNDQLYICGTRFNLVD